MGAHGPFCAFLALFLGVSAGASRPALAEAPTAARSLRARSDLSLAELAELVRSGAPEIAAGRRAARLADLDARRARLLDNPTLDTAYATIPVGRTNPADLRRPFAEVPSYAVGLSYTFPVGKRAPRRRRADALARAAHAELALSLRDLTLTLAEVLGEIATATLRREGIGELVAGGRRAQELAEARLAAQFGTPLDVDQMRTEVQRTEQLLAGADSDMEAALAACAAIAGVPCEGFASAHEARAYLARWAAPQVAAADLEARPDLRALRAQAEAAHAEVALAEAARLPDPTVRLGYVHDRFVISGNQLNSLNVALSVPLPVFDRGRVQKRAAEVAEHELGEERARRRAVARARIPALERRLALSQRRCATLEHEVIPGALGVLASLETAVESRLIPVTQVIQARRTVSELLIEEADSCGEAFSAAVALRRERPVEGDVP